MGIPRVEDERLRDLVRAREDLRGDLMRARHRIGKLLMRRELAYPGPGGTWTLAHLDWLRGLHLGDRASELTVADHLHAHDVLVARRDRLNRALTELAGECRFAPVIARLRCLRAVETLTALGLCVEAGGFDRFVHPERLACYLGPVPSEDTSGERRRQGAITKAGSGHARRLLVEVAGTTGARPGSPARWSGASADRRPWTIDCAWRAQRRLHRRWQRLQQERGKRGGIVAVAVARELSHFCWELATTQTQ